MEVNVDMLEQMDLMDMNDQEALDVFLNSGEDNAVLSPVLGRRCQTCIKPLHIIPSESRHQGNDAQVSKLQ